MFSMSSHVGFSVKVRTRVSKIHKNVFKGVRVLAPLFFVAGGSFYPAEERSIFSELSNVPAVTMTENLRTLDEKNVPVEVTKNSKHDDEVIVCRWRTDRALLSTLGKKPKADDSRIGCLQSEDAKIDTHLENPRIREKVTSLASNQYPLSEMAASISTYDADIAGLIVGIAKKESDWGKRTPKLHGEECFNYWGYRGYGNRGVTEDGYGCFEKPADAVNAIGNRLIELSQKRGATDPEKMIVWKCGSSCVTHSPESVRKWISDVNVYYQQFAEGSL